MSDPAPPSEPPKVWPRVGAGWCSCPYCTAIRAGELEVPQARSPWLERMGAGRE